MPVITYIGSDGVSRAIDVPIGATVMEGGRNGGVAGIVAECGGACSCCTCHVHVAPEWVVRLPAIEEMEGDMLEFADNADPARSRLSCQLRVDESFEGLVVSVPEA